MKNLLIIIISVFIISCTGKTGTQFEFVYQNDTKDTITFESNTYIDMNERGCIYTQEYGNFCGARYFRKLK